MTLAVPTRPRASVTVLDTVEPDLAREFLTLYRDAFRPLETLAPCRQYLNDDEFLAEMADPSVVKFIAYRNGEEPVALAFMATDLSVVPWISKPYFEARFPDHMARGALYYFGGLLVKPERQGGPWAYLLLQTCVKRMAEERAIAAFDCCQFNVETTRLPAMIEAVGNRFAVLEPVELEPQRYFAFDFQGAR